MQKSLRNLNEKYAKNAIDYVQKLYGIIVTKSVRRYMQTYLPNLSKQYAKVNTKSVQK